MSNITKESIERAAELVERYVPIGTKTDRTKLAKAIAARLDGMPYKKALATAQYKYKKLVIALIKCAEAENTESGKSVRRSARLRRQKK